MIGGVGKMVPSLGRHTSGTMIGKVSVRGKVRQESGILDSTEHDCHSRIMSGSMP